MTFQSNLVRGGKGSKKGQFFSYDAMVAGILFAVLLAILFIYWTSLRSLLFTQIDDLMRIAIEVSSSLLTAGNPADWGPSDVKQIGIATGVGTMRINSSKLESFRLMSISDYDGLRTRLATGPYDIAVSIGNLTMGRVPSTVVKGSVSIVRPIVYEGIPANLTVMIWSNFTQ